MWIFWCNVGCMYISDARWTSISQELERLKVERKLKAGLSGDLEQGDVTVEKICLPVKSFQTSYDLNSSVLVLIKSAATVTHSEVLTLDKKTIR